MNRKNSAPQKRPPAMLTKTFGSVWKIRRRAVIGLDAEGEAGGEDDRACHERDEGVQRADADGLAGRVWLLAHVAAEDLHRGNAEAQGEEGLVHGGGDYRCPESVLRTDALRRAAGRISVPSAAPGSAGYGSPSTTMSASSAQHHVSCCTRSRPFCRPKLQTRKPAMTTRLPSRSPSLRGIRQHGAEYATRLRRCPCRRGSVPVRNLPK